MPSREQLTHYDRKGRVRMVDVGAKPETVRSATAAVLVRMKASTRRAVRRNPKGNPLEIARIAGITAAKRTADLIPLFHPLMLSHAAGGGGGGGGGGGVKASA